MTSALTQSCQYLDLGLGSRTTRNKFLLYISQLVFGTGFLGGSMVESTSQCRKHQFDPWVWKMPWRRKWQPTPVLLPGKSHGQRSLASYSPWGHKRVRDDLATKQQHMSVVPHSPHSVLLSMVSVIHSEWQSTNIKWNISEINNSQILTCMLLWVMKFHTILLHPTCDMTSLCPAFSASQSPSGHLSYQINCIPVLVFKLPFFYLIKVPKHKSNDSDSLNKAKKAIKYFL